MMGALDNGLQIWDERRWKLSVINEFLTVNFSLISCHFKGRWEAPLVYLRVVTLAKFLDVKMRSS